MHKVKHSRAVIGSQAFIIENWKTMDDYELADNTNLSFFTVKKYRSKLGLKRKRKLLHDKNLIAMCIDFYANGLAKTNIGNMLKVNEATIRNLINEHYTFKEVTADTLTITAQSKLNFNQND